MAVLEPCARPVSAVSLGGKFQISSRSRKLPTISRFYNGNAAPRYGTPTPISALSKPQTIDRYRLGVLP